MRKFSTMKRKPSSIKEGKNIYEPLKVNYPEHLFSVLYHPMELELMRQVFTFERAAFKDVLAMLEEEVTDFKAPEMSIPESELEYIRGEISSSSPELGVKNARHRMAKMIQCAELQLKSAHEYHKYFGELQVFRGEFRKTIEQLIPQFDPGSIQIPLSTNDLQGIFLLYQDAADKCLADAERIRNLEERRKALTPLELRTIYSDNALESRCLADIQIAQVELEEALRSFVLHTGEGSQPPELSRLIEGGMPASCFWEVKTQYGDVLSAPAILFALKAQSDLASETCTKLASEWCSLWTELINQAALHLLRLLSCLYLDPKQSGQSPGSSPGVRSYAPSVIGSPGSTLSRAFSPSQGYRKVNPPYTLDSLPEAIHDQLAAFKALVNDSLGRHWSQRPRYRNLDDATQMLLDLPISRTPMPLSPNDAPGQGRSRGGPSPHGRRAGVISMSTSSVNDDHDYLEGPTPGEQDEDKVVMRQTPARGRQAPSTPPRLPFPLENLPREQDVTAEFKRILDQLDKIADLYPGDRRQSVIALGKDPDSMRGEELGVTLRMQRESFQSETTSMGVSEDEHKMQIEAVIDPQTRKRLTMQEALESGVLVLARGAYVQDAEAGDEMSIFEAIERGLIRVASRQSIKKRDEQFSYGVVTVRTTTEARPFHIKHVLDKRTQDWLVPSDAIDLDLLDSEGTWVRNAETEEQMTVLEGIDAGLVEVLYDETTPSDQADTKGESTKQQATKQYAVYSVEDRAAKRKLEFKEATQKGILDSDEGTFLDTSTQERMGLAEAVALGYVLAKPMEVASALEEQERQRRTGRKTSVMPLGDGSLIQRLRARLADS